MKKFPRFEEYKILAIRILLAYVFYSIARVLFYVYNSSLIKVDNIIDFLKLCFHGLAFDTTTILYVNSLFIIGSIIPVLHNSRKKYQKTLFYLYFIPNLVAYSANFIDFIYYRYTFSRSTRASLDTLENESNKMLLLFDFILNYWHVFLLFFALSFILILLYKKTKILHKTEKPHAKHGAIPQTNGFLFTVLNVFLNGSVSFRSFLRLQQR